MSWFRTPFEDLFHSGCDVLDKTRGLWIPVAVIMLPVLGLIVLLGAFNELWSCLKRKERK